MCGQNLQDGKTRRRKISWLDAVLVLFVVTVIAVWWRSASQPEATVPPPVITIPSQVDLPTSTPTATPATPTATPRPAPTPFVHQVKSGETLLSIAGQYGVTVADLQSANGLSDVLIRIGDDLYIPQTGIPGESAATGENAAEGGANGEASVFTYEVKPGDTVVSIAIRFGTTVEAILTANKMVPTDFIQPNQTLLIPVGDLPSEVLEVSSAAGGDPASSATGDQQSVYAAVRLLGPADRGEVPIDEATLFRWLSVDILQPNEWYVLRIWSADGVYPDPPSVWTKATSHRITVDFDLATGGPAQFRWQVSVVRVLPDQGAGYELQAASFPSDIRSLTWQ